LKKRACLRGIQMISILILYSENHRDTITMKPIGYFVRPLARLTLFFKGVAYSSRRWERSAQIILIEF
jgi:hypothetical protein